MFLCRKLDDRHVLYKSFFYPKKVRNVSSFRYRVILGVGGNMGDMKRRLNRLWVYLERSPRIRPIQSGPVLRNPPFGYLDQDDFHNTVIEIATSLVPRQLLREVWRIEKHFGRKRSFPNAPRTLDLDIIFFDERKIRTQELIVPHPGWKTRSSVTIPLGQIPQKRKTVWR